MRQNLDELGLSLSLENFKKILKSGDFRHVGLHGWGEPLLNPQLFQMIEYAESEGVYTNLTTNGTLIGGNIDKILSSGLREIAFGIYHKDRLSSISPQIKDLIRERNEQGLRIPKIYMDITIFKGSLNQIPLLVEIASELGIDAVILHRLVKVHKADTSIGYISAQEEKELFIEVKRLARKGKLRLYLPQRHTLPCKAVKHCIFVTLEGKVTPCCFLPEFYLGDALKEGVRKIIRSRRYGTFVRTMSEHPICVKCPL